MAEGIKFLFLALALVFLLRLPSLVDPMYYLDEGVYASVAYEMGQGGRLYQTAWDLKPPGIFLVYLFFQKTFGSQAFLAQRVFNTTLGVLAVWGVYLLAKILNFRKNQLLIVALFSAVYLGLPFFETQILNTENIFAVTSLFAFIFGLKFKGRWRAPFIAGALFGIGQWLKIHPIFDLAAFGIFAFWKFRFDRRFWLPFALGILAPLAGLFLYLSANGILAGFVETNISYNLFYVGEMPQIKIFGNLITRTLLLVVTAVILFFLKTKNKISEKTLLLSLWFAFVFYGALLSARAYGHYFIPVLIPAAILLAVKVRIPTKLGTVPTFVATAALVLLPFVGYTLLQTPVRAETFRQEIFSNQTHFYQHRLSYLIGKMDRREFEKDFTPKPWRLRELKSYLDENVSKDEQVYIWGVSPFANYVLERRPVQKYLMWFHVLGVGDREKEVYQDLLAEMPEIIIVEDNQPEGESYEISRPPFLKLQLLIDANYQFETTIAGYNVYKWAALAIK